MTVKNFIRTPFGLFVTSFILATIIFCVMRSIRWKQSGRQHLDSLIQEGKVPIIIFWHEHIFAMPHFLPRPSSALQSPHPDGKVLAHAVRYFGLRPIYGSSNRQAISGMRQMMREIRKGRCAVVTPDGPRGPANILSPGAAAMAELSASPIIPVAWKCDKCWTLSSWDKMRIPKPFSAGVMVWGKPVWLPKSANKEEAEKNRLRLEQLLNTHKMDTDSSATGYHK